MLSCWTVLPFISPDEGISYISPSKALRVFELDCASLGARVICRGFQLENEVCAKNHKD